LWHDRGMARVRLSTTVDERLLNEARALFDGVTDAAVLDEALEAATQADDTASLDPEGREALEGAIAEALDDVLEDEAPTGAGGQDS